MKIPFSRTLFAEIESRFKGKKFYVKDFSKFAHKAGKPESAINSSMQALLRAGFIEKTGDTIVNENGGNAFNIYKLTGKQAIKPIKSHQQQAIEQNKLAHARTLELQEIMGIRVIPHEIPKGAIHQHIVKS